jgi:uncharacterized membrane protein
MESEHQVPIWFFIGALLLVYGVIIFAAGVYGWVFPPPPEARVALWGYHADVWWGMLMTVIGGVYCLKFRPSKESEATG